MIKITDPEIEGYILSLTLETDEHILEMEKIAKKNNFPIVNRLVGRLLFILAKIKNPKLVVELGSGFGYSAYWFARAITEGTVVLTDYKEKNIEYAGKTFRKAGLLDRVVMRLGEAIEIAKEYRGIDILFIDIEKHQYLSAIKTLLPHLNENALVIADNALWYGKVLQETTDRQTMGIKEFNEFMFNHKDFFTTIIPIRDGVLVAYKY